MASPFSVSLLKPRFSSEVSSEEVISELSGDGLLEIGLRTFAMRSIGYGSFGWKSSSCFTP